ncbi:hypothetical protein QRD90_09790 [Peribacillus frigoritolerans]|nr:hypothetical protein [Peribacillus frigoritolerans]WJE49436.1 hypothetical protein QRD90_09790 [Peribacillus frigoritolerans]
MAIKTVEYNAKVKELAAANNTLKYAQEKAGQADKFVIEII